MASQWQNFQRNLGAWRGSFTNVDAHGRELECSASLLTLSSADEGRAVHFRLRRSASGDPVAAPSQDTAQEYRTLGKQVVFFDNGSFSKGSLQIAPATRFGAEYGFISGDRRHRLVQLFADDGTFSSLVLIREFRDGSGATERPPLSLEQLGGRWQGQAATIEADWPEPTLVDASIAVDQPDAASLRLETRLGPESTVVVARPVADAAGPWYSADGLSGDAASDAGQAGRLLLLPDGGLSLAPLQISHRQGFRVEAGWLESPHRWQRLIRRYGPRGEWLSSTHLLARRI
ncbi:MAG: DUF3598 family protein [Cyanobium sp. PLM2.Bin73]|jgi:hypothetical protein|nr:MAG: DUF3598 family protein [Cyanobium sp. PLM2.Bin73]